MLKLRSAQSRICNDSTTVQSIGNGGDIVGKGSTRRSKTWLYYGNRLDKKGGKYTCKVGEHYSKNEHRFNKGN